MRPAWTPGREKNTPVWRIRHISKVLTQEMLSEGAGILPKRLRLAKTSRGGWVDCFVTCQACFCHIPCLAHSKLSQGRVRAVVPIANLLFYLKKQGLTKCTRKCPPASFLEPQGTMQRCPVTLQFPLNYWVLFGALVWQVSLFDSGNSPGVTFLSLRNKKAGTHLSDSGKAGRSPLVHGQVSRGRKLYLPS